MLTFIFAALLGLGLSQDVKDAQQPQQKRPAHEDAIAFAVAHLEYKGRPSRSEWEGKI